MNRIHLFVVFIAAFLPLSCKDCATDGGDNDNGNSINPKIQRIRYCCTDFGGGNFRMGVWYSDKIFYVVPARLLRMDNSFNVVEDSLILREPSLFVSRNTSGTKLLMIKSQYTDVSIGGLSELNLQSLQTLPLRDSSYNISSAIYLPGQNGCVYYSYGSPALNRVAGYYVLDLTTLEDSLLFQYASEIGPFEVVNGFDISPDGMRLLYPINRATEPPLIVEYTLAAGTQETLTVSFERQLLWLRYHPTGSQIVYSNYPRGAGGSTVGTDSEIGIIERATRVKRILDVNTNPGWYSVSVFPNWSPDGKHIVYGSAKGPATEPPGAKGAYSLYILRDVN